MSTQKRGVFLSPALKQRIGSLPMLVVLFFVVSLPSFNSSPISEGTSEEAETYNTYYNYVELTRRLKSLAQKYPHLANLSSVGQSVEGRELWVMRISTNPGVDQPGKPKFKYVGNMHGDETVSRQVLVYLVEYLLARCGEDPRIAELLNTTDISIMPSMNPDGFEKSVEGECNGRSEGRSNAKNMDLNRSFPDQFVEMDVNEDDVPERTAVMKWINENKFVLSGNLHGGTVVASYPFDDSGVHLPAGFYSQSPDDALFRYLARVYAQNNPVMATGEPKCEGEPDETFKEGITNGAYWYDVTGNGNAADICVYIVTQISFCFLIIGTDFIAHLRARLEHDNLINKHSLDHKQSITRPPLSPRPSNLYEAHSLIYQYPIKTFRFTFYTHHLKSLNF